MANDKQSIFTKSIVYQVEAMHDVLIEKDVAYTNVAAGALTMDIYHSKPDLQGEALKPAVIFVTGYPDPGFKAFTGYKLKEVEQYISWAKLLAASGYIAITYTNTEPEKDINTLLQYIVENAASFNIDNNSIGIWACSGNVPNALALLRHDQKRWIKCAVLCYGYMPDVGKSMLTAEAAKQFHFVNPCSSNSAASLPKETPILIVRAEQDEMPGLNVSVNQFMTSDLAQNLAISLMEVKKAPHAFDIMDTSAMSRQAIKNILSFIKSNLAAA